MTTAEAKAKIKKEFIERFYQWLDDEKNLSPNDYGWKYGWQKGDVLHQDNLKSVMTFQKYMFSGRWLPDWEKAGYDSRIIWDLNKEGFLSYQMYSNWMARNTGKTDFFFMSQKTAKEIYKEYKQKGGNAA